VIKKYLNIVYVTIVLAVMILSVGISRADDGDVVPTYSTEQTGQFIKQWLLCGPFPNPPTEGGLRHCLELPGFYNDYLQNHGGEKQLQVKPGQVEQFEDGNCQWFLYDSTDEVISLDKAISNDNDVLAYAYCEIVCPAAGYYTLAIGSNNGVRAWVNGHEVINNPRVGVLKLDAELAPVSLKAGINTLLVKVEEGGGLWELVGRLKEFKAEEFYSHDYFLPRKAKDNTYAMILQGNVNALPFDQVVFRLFDRDCPDKVIWENPWDKQEKTVLPAPQDQYKEYRLQVQMRYLNDQTVSREVTFSTGKKIDYRVFDKGRTTYKIVVAQDASVTEKIAAKNLAAILQQISGAEFEIIDDDAAVGQAEIVIGLNRHTEEISGGQTVAFEPEDETFMICNQGPHILIWGGKKRGSMYGVYTFLEKYLGCRWYTSAVKVFPERDTFKFSHMYYTDSPKVRFRSVDYTDVWDPAMAVPNKNNSQFHGPPGRADIEQLWLEHSFEVFVPPSEFFDSHPEYFALRDGKRQKERSQLCLTNPEVMTITIARLKDYILKHPGYRVYNVAQNDNQNPCQCQQCQKIVQDQQGESGVMLWFVNQVAQAVESEFPDKYIGTFAYQYTRKPPKTIRPRDNVMIILCSIECDFSHPFTHPHNQKFLDDLENWKDKTENILIWDYVINYANYFLPHPNFNVLQENIQILRDAGVVGILEQANGHCRTPDFSGLRAYVLTKLLWDPDCDMQEHVNDFIYGYYQRSGVYIRQYYDLVQSLVKPSSFLTYATRLSNSIFNRDFLEKANELLDKAEAAADNDEILRRVEMARLVVINMNLLYDPRGAVDRGELQRLKKIVQREGITWYSEGTPFAKSLEYFKKEFDKTP